MTWQFTLAGLFVGILVGMTGMGGGSLMTPILILFFGFALSMDVDQIPTLILDADGTAASRELIARFAGSRFFREIDKQYLEIARYGRLKRFSGC